MESRSVTGGARGGWFGIALAVFATGCGGNVVVDTGGQGGNGGDGGGGDGGMGGVPGTGSTGVSTGVGGDASAAIALSYAQLEAATPGTGGGNGSSGGVGGGPSPDTQFLMYGAGSEEPSCGKPYGPGGCGGWNVVILVPPDAFQVGTWPLWEEGFNIAMFETFDEGGNICSAGGGAGIDEGQIEIMEITDTTVRFSLSGLAGGFSFDPTGTFLAQRCP